MRAHKIQLLGIYIIPLRYEPISLRPAQIRKICIPRRWRGCLPAGAPDIATNMASRIKRAHIAANLRDVGLDCYSAGLNPRKFIRASANTIISQNVNLASPLGQRSLFFFLFPLCSRPRTCKLVRFLFSRDDDRDLVDPSRFSRVLGANAESCAIPFSCVISLVSLSHSCFLFRARITDESFVPPLHVRSSATRGSSVVGDVSWLIFHGSRYGNRTICLYIWFHKRVMDDLS